MSIVSTVPLCLQLSPSASYLFSTPYLSDGNMPADYPSFQDYTDTVAGDDDDGESDQCIVFFALLCSFWVLSQICSALFTQAQLLALMMIRLTVSLPSPLICLYA